MGKDQQEQRIGDVLFSKSVINYEKAKYKDRKVEERSLNVESGQLLFNRFYSLRSWTHEHELPAENEEERKKVIAKKIPAVILCGEKLIDSQREKEKLFKRYPNASGGDMESFGVYAACRETDVAEWIMVKGICDFAENKSKNKKANQQIAATAAVSLCLAVFELDNVFDDLRANPSRIITDGSVEEPQTAGKKPPVPEWLTTSRPLSIQNIDKEIPHRKSLIEEIVSSAKCEQSKILLLNGMGGIGKTAVARALCAHSFFAVRQKAWVEYDGSLRDSFLRSFNIPGGNGTDAAEKFVIIKSLFEGKKELLLVIDNYNFVESSGIDLNEQEQTDMNWLSCLKCPVVITSRSGELKNFTPRPVDFLSEDSCVDVFYLNYKKDETRKEEETVRKLVRRAGRHTLAVELLAKTAVSDPARTLEEFYGEIKRIGFNLSDEAEVETPHSKTALEIAEHIRKLYDFAGLPPAQEKILKNMALMPDMKIPKEMREWLKAGRKDLAALNKAGWIDADEEGYNMHTVIRESVLLKGEVGFGECEDLIRAFAEEDFIKKDDIYSEVKILLEVADAYCRYFMNKKYDELLFAGFLNKIAIVYREQGKYEQALAYHEKALEIKEKVLGKEHPSTGATYNNMALVYYKQGEYEQAFAYFEKALGVKEKVLGKEHPSTGDIYNNMAIVYSEQGKYEQALAYLKKALEIKEKVLGKEHPSTGSTYNNMAVVYKNQGKYEQALAYYKKALEIKEKVPGKEYPSTGNTYNNMAVVYKNQGKYKQALAYYKKALEIKEKVLGKEHPSTGSTYNNMANVYDDQGKYGQALAYYEKALEIFEKVLGKEHPSTGSTCYNIAFLYEEQKDYATALEWYKKSYLVYQAYNKKYGVEHHKTQAVYEALRSAFDLSSSTQTFEEFMNGGKQCPNN